MNRNLTARSAMRFVILFGIVTLFADTTHEGARSIAGPYLLILGASGTAVGFVVSAGRRATAFGVMNLAFGVFWFAGSALIGVLYDRSICAATQLAAVPLFLISTQHGEAS